MGAGTVAALVLVIAFGNQWLWEELLKKDDPGDNSGWHILSWLSVPHWVIDKSGFFEEMPGKNIAGFLVGVLALLVVVAFVLGASTRRGYANPFISGWFSLVAGGAAYNIVAYLIIGDSGLAVYDDAERSLSGALSVLAGGAGYGFLAGWAVGGVCAMVASAPYGSGQFGGQFSYSAPPPPTPPPGGGYRY